MPHLANPYALFLLFPWAFAAWRVFRHATVAGLLFAPVHRLPPKTGGWRTFAAKILPVFFLLGALLLIFAAARPQTLFARINRTSDAIAIMMTVDVSGSMEALDLTPKNTLNTSSEKNRLDVVKDTFKAFINERPADLVGLVTFGGFAATRAPLTLDHAAVLHALDGVTIPSGTIDAQGRPLNQEELLTAVGDGLTTAAARLENAEPKTRIIVLLSDGESNTGLYTPEQAAQTAKELGIRVYTIGIGSNSGTAPVRTKDMFERSVLVTVSVDFNEKQLRDIADTTGGKYFRVGTKDGLTQALDDINALETTPIQQQTYNRYNEHFLIPLLAGALLLLLAVTLNIQITRRLV